MVANSDFLMSISDPERALAMAVVAQAIKDYIFGLKIAFKKTGKYDLSKVELDSKDKESIKNGIRLGNDAHTFFTVTGFD